MDAERQERLEVLQDQALAEVEKKLDDLQDMIGELPAVTDEELADLDVKIDPEEWEKFIEAIREWEDESRDIGLPGARGCQDRRR